MFYDVIKGGQKFQIFALFNVCMTTINNYTSMCLWTFTISLI